MKKYLSGTFAVFHLLSAGCASQLNQNRSVASSLGSASAQSLTSSSSLPTISLSQSTVSSITGETVTITPTLGASVTSVSISPALGNGLSLNTTTGVISGTVTGSLDTTSYTLTALNADSNSATANLSLSIRPNFVLTGPSEIFSGLCSTFDLSLKDYSGNLTTLGSNLTFNLTGINGAYYSLSSSCSTSATTFTISSSQSSAKIYYKTATTGTDTLTFASSIFSGASATKSLTLSNAGTAGNLDTTFGSAGTVTTPIGATTDQGKALIQQLDGKIVAVGNSHNGTNNDFAVIRYNADGTLDTSFNTTGITTQAIGNNTDNAYAVALQPDQKIVVAGGGFKSGKNTFGIMRFNTDGSLDTSFNTTGKVSTALGTTGDQALGVAIQTDGKIVAAGTYAATGTNRDFAVVRYSTDGSLDTTFNTTGKVTTALSASYDDASSVAIQTDGKIVVAGSTTVSALYKFALARYNSDGSLDTGFGTSGIVTTAIGSSNDMINSMVLQKDGKIVVGGVSTIVAGTSSKFALARYNTDGSLDTSFGTSGITTTWISTGQDVINGITLQPDGKIVAVGYSTFSLAAVARYNTDGTLDTSFNTTGTKTFAFGTTVSMSGVIIQADGKIASVGTTTTTTSDFGLFRMWP